MKYKSVGFFPLSTYDLGSSRIRVGNIVRELKKENINAYEYIPNGNYFRRYFNVFKHDILVFQKTCDPAAFIAIIFAKILKKKCIFDTDDNYYFKETVDISSFERFKLFFFRLIFKMNTKLCDYITVNFEELAEIVKQYNSNVLVMPMNLDMDNYKVKSDYSINKKIIIGWIGDGLRHRKNFKILVEPLKSLSEKYPIVLKVVGARKNERLYSMFKDIETDFIDEINWKDPNEISKQLLSFDIGISSLEDDEYNQSKGQYKAEEYLASGLPSVISKVGDAEKIITDGVNGYLADSQEEWIEKIEKLINSEDLRRKFGLAGRESIFKHSSKKIAQEYIEFFKEI